VILVAVSALSPAPAMAGLTRNPGCRDMDLQAALAMTTFAVIARRVSDVAICVPV